MNSSCFIICELNWIVFMAMAKHFRVKMRLAFLCCAVCSDASLGCLWYKHPECSACIDIRDLSSAGNPVAEWAIRRRD